MRFRRQKMIISRTPVRIGFFGGDELEECRALGRELGLCGRKEVFFLQLIPHEDLRALYQRTSVFVTLSWHEGFCLPVVEAMSSGALVVASRFGAIGEIVDGGGLLVDPREAEEVAAILSRLLLNEDLQKSLADRGFERAQEFSWRKRAHETLKVYQELAHR